MSRDRKLVDPGTCTNVDFKRRKAGGTCRNTRGRGIGTRRERKRKREKEKERERKRQRERKREREREQPYIYYKIDISFVNVVALKKKTVVVKLVWCSYILLLFTAGASPSLGGPLDGGGCGHTNSFVFSLQNTQILSKRYCCRSRDKPVGVITGGRSLGSGFQLGSFSRHLFSSGESELTRK